MIARYFYQEDIATFLAEDSETIFGKIAHADEMDTSATQKFAWEQEIAIMKDVLRPYANEPGQIIFEYTIPRMGKRIDVVVLLHERIFAIEFKGGNDWNQIQKDERRAYLINAYRVLLTRARQGMIICVPEGDHSIPPDKSRNPKYYDATYEYLKSLGLEEI